MSFPSTLTTFTRPTTTNTLNSPSHSGLHNTVSSALGQVEAVIGVDGTNSVVGTMMYDLRSPASGGGGHVQDVNKGGTGYTSYTKGDILVAQSSSVLTKVALGSNGQALVVDTAQATGIKWGAAGFNIQSFISNGTWVKPSLITVASRTLVQLWGGGGSGGSGATTGKFVTGGGGGGYIEGWFSTSVLGATELVYVGKGGDSVLSANGNAGDPTVFGSSSLLSVFGGGYGDRDASGIAFAGGGGGWFGPGIAGEAGSYGSTNTSIFSSGGATGSSATSALAAMYSAGGGAGGGGNGGKAIYGGAGGGGYYAGSVAGLGGVSNLGGYGGNASIHGNGGAGCVLGGGGAAAFSPYYSGKGGDGKAIIITYV